MILFKTYNPEEYPKYDNYDAINVDKTAEIPMDYYGVMGVPITFLDKYNPEQFEIVGNEIDLQIERGRGYINGKRMYSRIFIRCKQPAPVAYMQNEMPATMAAEGKAEYGKKQ